MNIRDAFNNFKVECEKFARDGLAQAVINMTGYEWQKEVFEKLTNVYKLETDVDHLSGEISDQEKDTNILAYYIMKRSLMYFQIYQEQETSIEILEGRFLEGEKVTVSIDGNKITRVVHYSKDAGDLYITYKNKKYFYSEVK